MLGAGGNQSEKLNWGTRGADWDLGLPWGAVAPKAAKAPKSRDISGMGRAVGSGNPGKAELCPPNGDVGWAKAGSRCRSLGDSSTTSMLRSSSLSSMGAGFRFSWVKITPWMPTDTRVAMKVGCFQKVGPDEKAKDWDVIAWDRLRWAVVGGDRATWATGVWSGGTEQRR